MTKAQQFYDKQCNNDKNVIDFIADMDIEIKAELIKLSYDDIKKLEIIYYSSTIKSFMDIYKSKLVSTIDNSPIDFNLILEHLEIDLTIKKLLSQIKRKTVNISILKIIINELSNDQEYSGSKYELFK